MSIIEEEDFQKSCRSTKAARNRVKQDNAGEREKHSRCHEPRTDVQTVPSR